MIPLLVGVLPAQNTTQSSNTGSSDSGSAFGDLLASVLPTGQDTAEALEETEPETADQAPAGTGSEAFAEQQLQARLAVPMPNLLPLDAADPVALDAAAPVAVDSAAPAVVEATTPAIADPASPASPATLEAVAPGVVEVPLSLADAPDMGTSAPAIQPVAASGADTAASSVAAGSPAAVGTNPIVVSPVGGAAQDAQAKSGGNGSQATDEVDEIAAVSADEVPAEEQGPAVDLEARPSAVSPENKLSPVAQTPGFQVPVSHDAARSALSEAPLGVGAVSGGKTIAVENVVSREPLAQPINRQLLGPIASLASGPHGERTLSVNIAPEALGPVTVKAHLGHAGMRVELTAPTEAGREALRAMLPELRRDLAATGAGTVSIATATDAGAGAGTGAGTFSGGGQSSMANDHRFGGAAPAAAGPGRQQGEEAARVPANDVPPSAHASSHLDVMA